MRWRIDVHIDAQTYFLCALLLLTLPLPWLFAIILAAAAHELGHSLAVIFLGGKISKIKLEGTGAEIICDYLDDRATLISTLSGPFASLMLAMIMPLFPRIGFCALIQGMFNLLPVYPMDGGKAFDMICIRKEPDMGSNMKKLHMLRLFLAVLVAAILAAITNSLLLILFLIPTAAEKYLAKRREKGYNNATIEMR